MDGPPTGEGHSRRIGAGHFGLPTQPALSRARAVTRDIAGMGVGASAATLTLHALACLVAGLAAVAGMLGLAASYPATSDAVMDVMRALGGGSLAENVRSAVESPVRNPEAAVLLLLAGLGATAVLSWSYLRAFQIFSMPLAGDDAEVAPGRGPLAALIRVLLVETLVVIGLAALATGAVADAIGDVAGISGDAVLAWDVVKWPLLMVTAFGVFTALQRTAFTDARRISSSSVAFSHVLAATVWLLTATGFVLYLVSFGSFQNSYGTIGATIVLLIWLTMFSMLHYATPDLRGGAVGTIGAGAALGAVAWLLSWALLAVFAGSLDALGNAVSAIIAGLLFVVGLWATNVALLLGVRLHALKFAPTLEAVTAGDAIALERPSEVPDEDALFHAVSQALQSDVAHDTMLGPIAPRGEGGEASRLSELELDLSDWGFTYGVAWAKARAQDPVAPDGVVADRALRAAQRVFRHYCGDPDWQERIQLQTGRRRRRFERSNESDEHPVVPANGHGTLHPPT